VSYGFPENKLPRIVPMTSKSTAIITELLQKSVGREEEPTFTLAGCGFSSHLCAPIILLWAPDVPAVFPELQVPVFRLAHSLFPPSDPSPEKCPNREHYDESRVPQMLANCHNRNKALELLYRLPKPGCSHGEIRYNRRDNSIFYTPTMNFQRRMHDSIKITSQRFISALQAQQVIVQRPFHKNHATCNKTRRKSCIKAIIK
jgi:hypothetical protein